MVPVELSSRTLAMTLNDLFWYMVLPVIWLVMTALVYGYDVRDDKELLRIHARVERFGERYKAMPAFLRDFVEHLIRRLSRPFPADRQRRQADTELGVVLIVTLIVGYRFIDWAAAWLWLADDPRDRSARPRQLAAPVAGRDAAVRQPVPGFRPASWSSPSGYASWRQSLKPPSRCRSGRRQQCSRRSDQPAGRSKRR